LFNELRWLLGAATEWSIQDQLKLGLEGYDVQVYALDSVALHARSLFEFFATKATGNHYGVTQFLGVTTPLQSCYEAEWADPLHKFLMHAQDRSQSVLLNSPDGKKELNEMPVYFAREVLRLWEEFENELGKSGKQQDLELQDLARQKRRKAIENAQYVVDSDITRLFASVKRLHLKPVF